MTNGTEDRREPDAIWPILGAVFGFYVLQDILEQWLTKPVAAGIALIFVFVVLFRIFRTPQASFRRYAPYYALFVLAIVETLLVIPYQYCGNSWAPLACGGAVAALYALFCPWIPPLRETGDVKFSTHKSITVAVLFGAVTALAVYISPEQFCR